MHCVRVCVCVLAYCKKLNCIIISTQITTEAVEASAATVAKMKSTTADDDSSSSVKARDLWVDVNGVPTRVLCWGQPIDEDNKHELKRVVMCVCGNPGITEFYEKFLQEVYRTLKVPVWVLSHAGTNIMYNF